MSGSGMYRQTVLKDIVRRKRLPNNAWEVELECGCVLVLKRGGRTASQLAARCAGDCIRRQAERSSAIEALGK